MNAHCKAIVCVQESQIKETNRKATLNLKKKEKKYRTRAFC